MQYRQLGRTGLKVSPICLGTMMFGGPTDEAMSKRIIDKAHGAGINFIDTADAYSKGGSEEVVGRAIASNRNAWVLATKLANPMGDGLGIVPYSPLARGVLTGKYKPDAVPDKETRAGRNDTRMMQTEWRPESLRLAQEIKTHAEKKGITAGQFAVAWVLNSAFVSSVIAGPRTEEQWDGYISALDYSFTTEDEALVDRLVTPGHPSTPGYNDPAYPIEGRRARTA
ncbi:aldo/keto reductase [Bradyrhizobium sp. RP6]|uniref:aldo/keto reductase n=1 Tax=Bradyrhizobium sp. RP6 TaxID=2489596 RepID=UPI000F547BE9|nr:aldo/keto reductase [Bradyrhizobium sp. RP6]RQH14227.1 aldo/keto reductase [Bradyrhizobium sp. RP6]